MNAILLPFRGWIIGSTETLFIWASTLAENEQDAWTTAACVSGETRAELEARGYRALRITLEAAP